LFKAGSNQLVVDAVIEKSRLIAAEPTEVIKFMLETGCLAHDFHAILGHNIVELTSDKVDHCRICSSERTRWR
jgi:hypothetical protein